MRLNAGVKEGRAGMSCYRVQNEYQPRKVVSVSSNISQELN